MKHFMKFIVGLLCISLGMPVSAQVLEKTVTADGLTVHYPSSYKLHPKDGSMVLLEGEVLIIFAAGELAANFTGGAEISPEALSQAYGDAFRISNDNIKEFTAHGNPAYHVITNAERPVQHHIMIFEFADGTLGMIDATPFRDGNYDAEDNEKHIELMRSMIESASYEESDSSLTVLDETISSVGLTASYPSAYIAQAPEENVVGFTDPQTNTFISIRAGYRATLLTNGAQTSTESADIFMDDLPPLYTLGENGVEEFVVNGKPAYFIHVYLESIGEGYEIFFEFADGTIGAGALYLVEGEQYATEYIELMKAIIESATYNAPTGENNTSDIDLSELDSTASIGALTVNYPSSYFAEYEEEQGAIILTDSKTYYLILLLAGEGIEAFVADAESSTGAYLTFVNMLTAPDEVGENGVEEFTAHGNPAYLVHLDTETFGEAYIAFYQFNNDELGVAFLVGEGAEYTPEQIELVKAIVQSATYDTSINHSLEDIPDDAILIADMPDNTLWTSTGLTMPIPEGFHLMGDFKYIQSIIGLATENGSNISILDDSLVGRGGIKSMNQNIIPFTASLGGLDNYDPDIHLQTMDVSGRTIHYLSTADFVEAGTSEFVIYYFIVQLEPDGDHVALVQASYMEYNPEVDIPILFDFVKSISLRKSDT